MLERGYRLVCSALHSHKMHPLRQTDCELSGPSMVMPQMAGLSSKMRTALHAVGQVGRGQDSLRAHAACAGGVPARAAAPAWAKL